MKYLNVFLAFAVIGVSSPAMASEDLAKAKNCLACHSVSNKLVGPAFKDIAAKYKGDKGAVAALAAKIKGGSTGVWGPIPMPPNSISDDESTKLASWVLAQK